MVKKLEINIGDKFGNYIVIGEVFIYQGYRKVKVECQCGKNRDIYCSNVKRLKQCSTCRGKQDRKQKCGDKKHSLIIIKYIDNPQQNRKDLLVQCDCGKEFLMYRSWFGKTKTCKDCYHKNNVGNQHTSFSGYENVSGTYYSQIKLNAKKRELEFNLSIIYINYLLEKQDFKCALSGIKINVFDKTASLDRIDSSKGYTEDNVQWVHKTVNIMKMSMSDEKLLEWCRLILINKGIKL